jgi:hypothetical protein
MTKTIGEQVEDLKRYLDAMVADFEEEENVRAREDVAHMLQWVAEHSPQYSGDFAANWKICVNGVEASFTPQIFFRKGAGEPFRQGDAPAIQHALAAGVPLLARITIYDKVSIRNSAHRGEYIYSWAIENEMIQFRPENYEGGRVIARYLAAFKGGA